MSDLRVMSSCQVASSYASLSALLRTAGRRAEALTYAQVALEAKQRAFGPQHAEVAGAMLHLADLLRDLGRCTSILFWYCIRSSLSASLLKAWHVQRVLNLVKHL